MDIYPQNLGNRNHIEIVRRRAAVGYTNPNILLNQPLTPKLGTLGKFWAKGTGMTDEQAAIGNPAAATSTQTASVLTWFGGFIVAMLAAASVGGATHNGMLALTAFGMTNLAVATLGYGPFARLAFLKAHRALHENEIMEMIGRTEDALERAYLELARDAILVKDLPDAVAGNVRAALEALGMAMEGLPPVVAAPTDTRVLAEKAATLRQKATTESDSVTAESLIRQAESLEQRIASNERVVVMAKRSAALREEILAKIAVLRETIALQQTGAVDARSFAELSEAAQQVAKEAQSAANAQDELSRYLTGTEAQPVVQKVGR